MPRGRKKGLSIEENIAAIDEKIANAEEALKELKAQRKELAAQKEEAELKLLVEKIKESGKSLEEVIATL